MGGKNREARGSMGLMKDVGIFWERGERGNEEKRGSSSITYCVSVSMGQQLDGEQVRCNCRRHY